MAIELITAAQARGQGRLVEMTSRSWTTSTASSARSATTR